MTARAWVAVVGLWSCRALAVTVNSPVMNQAATQVTFSWTPDVVVIMDADCAISAGGIEQLARLAVARNRPVQADYVLRPPANPQGIAVVSALAFIVKNRVRPRGLHALGLP